MRIGLVSRYDVLQERRVLPERIRTPRLQELEPRRHAPDAEEKPSMMMTFATELIRFQERAMADQDGATAARVKGLRSDTEALRGRMLDLNEPDGRLEEAFGKLQDAAALYGRGTLANHTQRSTGFTVFTAGLAGSAEALQGAEADEVRIAGRQPFSAEQVPNPLADLSR